jgi:hypothetical protein
MKRGGRRHGHPLLLQYEDSGNINTCRSFYSRPILSVSFTRVDRPLSLSHSLLSSSSCLTSHPRYYWSSVRPDSITENGCSERKRDTGKKTRNCYFGWLDVRNCIISCSSLFLPVTRFRLQIPFTLPLSPRCLLRHPTRGSFFFVLLCTRSLIPFLANCSLPRHRRMTLLRLLAQL